MELPAETKLFVWCYRWNLFRIENGMGAVAYSNGEHAVNRVVPEPEPEPEPEPGPTIVQRPITDPEYICPITMEPIASGAPVSYVPSV